ncbi:MAG TPA: ABC transporter ATP-binding protein [Nitrososphaerales archaeon]|nr:ABC transporter ATP-binding protein [Nitrososphaerales archaeon]
MSGNGATKIEAQGLVKRYGRVVAVDGVSFSAKEGEVLGLLGPSGCGKTTVLRSISGLEAIDGGKILLDGVVVSSPAEKIFVPPEKRHLGFVFQSYALWPHMTVRQNIAYGLRGSSKEEMGKRIASSLELVGLPEVGERYPSQLSGGQQQRVALARSISYEPKVLLLDEPLSNLDQKERERVRGELRALLDRIGITTVFVTHDQEEAFVICDRVILMNHGKIEQEGTPDSLYGSPANLFVAEFIGRGNILKAELKSLDAAKHTAVLRVPEIGADLACEFDGEFPKNVSSVVIRRNEMGFSKDAPDFEENVLRGQVVGREYRGAVADHKIRIGGAVIVATTHKFEGLYETKEADTLYVHIPPRAIRPIAG